MPGDGLREIDHWLVERLAVPASLHDVEGRFVYVNPAAERASGLRNADMMGRHFTDPVPREDRANVEAHFPRAVECGEPTDFETWFVDAQGLRHGVRAMHFPLRDQDEIVGVLILAFDVRATQHDATTTFPPQLTPRQREILELVAAGHTTTEIAAELTIASETVRNHVRSILRELNAHSRPEAVAAAQRLGLLSLPPLRPR